MTETSSKQISDQNHENLKNYKQVVKILEKFLQVETFFPRSFAFMMLLPTNLNIVDMEHKNW